MKIIMGLRGSGKTTKLIKIAHENEGYIVCHNYIEAYRISETARELGTPINFPLTYEEFMNIKYHSAGIKEFYIDNIEIFAQEITDVPITVVSMTEGENQMKTP